MLSTEFIDDILNRMAAVEREAFTAAGVSIEIFPYPVYRPLAPYVGQWLSGYVTTRQSPREDLIELEFTIELVVGNVTAGIEGEKLAKINPWTILMHNAFRSNPLLISDAYTAKLAGLRQTLFVSGRGLVQLDAVEGGPPARWATYFVATAEYLGKFEQAHF